MTSTITRVLGSEHDPAARLALTEALAGLGASSCPLLNGVAGSQQVETAEITVQGRVVLVESETYVGLSVTGDDDLVLAIAAEVERRLRSPRASLVAARLGWSFQSPLTLVAMKERLDAASDHPWIVGDSERHGEYLGRKLATGTVARVYETDTGFIVNLSYRALDGDRTLAKNSLGEATRILHDTVLPCVLAHSIAETDPLD